MTPGRVAAHVFVASLDQPELDERDRHHLERVLRLRAGETVTASDGAGGWRRCAWADGALEPTGEVARDDRPSPPVAVGFALTKADKPEWVVQKLTETGVDRILPFVAERSVVRWDDAKAARNAERWRAVAREAAMQSRRVWLPVVEGPVPFAVVAAEPGVALADMGGEPPSLGRPVLLIGPEGGWSDAEREAGLPAVAVGPGVLRAETAAIAAGVVLCALRQGLVRST